MVGYNTFRNNIFLLFMDFVGLFDLLIETELKSFRGYE